jgi:hypothetical protein
MLRITVGTSAITPDHPLSAYAADLFILGSHGCDGKEDVGFSDSVTG